MNVFTGGCHERREAARSIAVDRNVGSGSAESRNAKVEPDKSEAAPADKRQIETLNRFAPDVQPDIHASIASLIKSKFAARPRASCYAVLAASTVIAAARLRRRALPAAP